MIYYIPSFNGDFRFAPKDDGTELTVAKPTLLEKKWLRKWADKALEKSWIDAAQENVLHDIEKGELITMHVEAKVEDAAALLLPIMGYKRVGVVTGLSYKDGKTELVEVLDKEHEEKVKKAEEKGAEAAATVKRPTLSCPECSGRPELDRMPCDVLWAFLNPRQKDEWVRDRKFTVVGGLTGHLYSLAPRDSEQARSTGRIAYDLDDNLILHHYDLTVPPEEELLASMLLLRHRENWLRVPGEVDPASRASPGTIFTNPLPAGDFYSVPLAKYFTRVLGV